MVRVFEAFAGVGAQRMALRNLGIPHEVVGISEIDKFAIQSYEAIHGPTRNFGDISKIDPNHLPDFDLFTYSFPCQDLSTAGKQQGMIKGQTRSGLLYECEKIIEAKRPKYLLLENVKNLVGTKFRPAFEEWLAYLESLGYTNYWQVLNAKDFNIPQNRERVFVVSVLGEHTGYEFPNPQSLQWCLGDFLEENVDEKYYLNRPFHLLDKPIKEAYEIQEVGFLPYQHHQVKQHQSNTVYWTGGINPTLAATDYKNPTKIIVPNIVQAALLEGATFQQDAKVQGCQGCARTILARDWKDAQRILIESENGYRVRKLTPLECWRLMGFSDNDFDCAKSSGMSNTQLYKQAGNSIVVSVLEGIFSELFQCVHYEYETQNL